MSACRIDLIRANAAAGRAWYQTGMNILIQFLARVTGKPSTGNRAAARRPCTPPLLEPMEGRRLMSATPTMLVDASPPGDAEYRMDRVFIKSWSTSGDADDRPTEEVAFYYNKIAFNYAT